MRGHLFFDVRKRLFQNKRKAENQFARISKLLKLVWVVSSHTKIDTDTNEYLDYKN